jgi:flagellar assembly factor FliW
LKLQTKYFGEIDYEASQVITFPTGLVGFDDEQEFLILPFAGSENHMLCLQSVQTSALAFVMLDPFSLLPDYTPALQDTELRLLGVDDPHVLFFYVLCAVKNPVSSSTVNLKCPIVVNPDTQEARQIIMETTAYEMRHPLSEFSHTKEASPC